MNGVELFLLGRALMKIGESAIPEPPGGGQSGSTRAVLIVATDIAAHPGTTASEIVARTGIPQSQVSTAVARLREAGSITTAPDSADGRRTLIHPAAEPSPRVAEIRATTVDDALATALDGNSIQLREVTDALAVLARHLAPGRS
ncbi:DNA-binding MarR family transcriptional regulator [Kitasatospora gansuensis]|uniref:DNA-binding MarR family transcriptional regulator n=1 Tax=Kitasatospora gansuensis TaxID=258050 RepID=A0A7W7SDB5_9ACTN|nr:helix-turn-helix domain-containing protein [Kitasatospora gansuensis]MBB4948381.1 DNA-binding MarR family transcriptional regulator [Kitasatospora gansuensis]